MGMQSLMGQTAELQSWETLTAEKKKNPVSILSQKWDRSSKKNLPEDLRLLSSPQGTRNSAI